MAARPLPLRLVTVCGSWVLTVCCLHVPLCGRSGPARRRQRWWATACPASPCRWAPRCHRPHEVTATVAATALRQTAAPVVVTAAARSLSPKTVRGADVDSVASVACGNI